ncbi:hypothetical protein ACVW1A_007620 [Bradyrhizobium sp. LB1.3]|uniref:hypothetical protein n=1 Tax=unclassified Bradyrhizobium TaxID=2631580 RepID=UPI003390919B
MAELAAELKDQANQLPAGAERERLLRKARFAETGARLSDWVSSSVCGLRSKAASSAACRLRSICGCCVVPILAWLAACFASASSGWRAYDHVLERHALGSFSSSQALAASSVEKILMCSTSPTCMAVFT